MCSRSSNSHVVGVAVTRFTLVGILWRQVSHRHIVSHVSTINLSLEGIGRDSVCFLARSFSPRQSAVLSARRKPQGGPAHRIRCRRRCALQVSPCAAACLPVCACTNALPRARCRPQRAMATAESDLEVRTMHVFISRALQKILKEAPKKLTALRTSCTSVLGACPRPAAAACARCEPAGRLSAPLNSTLPMLLWMRRGAPEEWRRLLSTAAGGGRVAAGDAAAGDALGI